MATHQPLSIEDRNFLTRVVKVAYSNPFSDEPDQLNDLMSGALPSSDAKHEHHFSRLAQVIEYRLKELAQKGIRTLNDVANNDRRLLESTFLFEVFHLFTDQFDTLIEQQQKQPEKPVSAPFAEDVIERFRERGFTTKSSYRYLALFYQLRRAYTFIRDGLIGQSSSMRQLRLALWNNVFTTDAELYMHYLWNRMEDFSTLLLGATGTGKGAAAAAIGLSGHIPYDPHQGAFKYSYTSTFSAINLSQFPENLIESELFGHRKGAFTGAIDQHKGVFERCREHGTLFLDEIGDVSIPVQIKLLNVLQERVFTPVGSHELKRFPGRVVAATNHSLDAMREAGRFREDFYYRLSSDVIVMPTLQQRLHEHPGELEQLVSDLVARMTESHGHVIVDRVMDALQAQVTQAYAWPGNVRELSQAVRRIILTGSYQSQPQQVSGLPGWLQQAADGDLTSDQLVAYYCAMLYEKERSYEAVAQRVEVNWRTVKKYVDRMQGGTTVKKAADV